MRYPNLLNPYCIQCRQPLQGNGRRWRCRRHENVITFFVSTTRERHKPPQRPMPKSKNAPFCLVDMVKMRSHAANWKCEVCGHSTRKASSRLSPRRLERKTQVEELAKQGHSIRNIERLLHMDRATIEGIVRLDYQRRPCECGQTMMHSGACKPRAASWRARLIDSNQRGAGAMEEAIVARISEAIPISLGVDARYEITQAMFLDVFLKLDAVIADVTTYIKGYYKTLPDRYGVSLDADPLYWQSRLVG